jgi:hypothetical protein
VQRKDLTKLARVLGLLGSDQPGERASAALAAHRLLTTMGTSWTELLQPKPTTEATGTKVVVHHVHEYGVDHQSAADARMRQLKSTNERLEKEVRSLRRRLAAIAEQERRQRMMADDEDDARAADTA